MKQLFTILVLLLIWLTPNMPESICSSGVDPDQEGTLLAYKCINITIADAKDISKRTQLWVPVELLEHMKLIKCPDV